MMKFCIPIWLTLILPECSPAFKQQGNGTSDCKKLYSYVIRNAHKRYLVAIKAHYASDTFQVVMDNYHLIFLLENTAQSNDSLRLERILRGQEAIQLSDPKRKIHSVVRPWKRIDHLLQYGKDSTINYFFGKYEYGFYERINVSLSDPERNYLISKLNDWCLLTYIDDESGYLNVRPLDSTAIKQ